MINQFYYVEGKCMITGGIQLISPFELHLEIVKPLS